MKPPRPAARHGDFTQMAKPSIFLTGTIGLLASLIAAAPLLAHLAEGPYCIAPWDSDVDLCTSQPYDPVREVHLEMPVSSTATSITSTTYMSLTMTT
jgi:hypothetical protein